MTCNNDFQPDLKTGNQNVSLIAIGIDFLNNIFNEFYKSSMRDVGKKKFS